MLASLEPVDRPLALGEQVYQTLRTPPARRPIVAGQPLQEVQLAEQLGVSRTPVREALTRLASEGLLVSDGRSFMVPALTLADVDDIYEIRLLIEPAAMARVSPTHRRCAAVARRSTTRSPPRAARTVSADEPTLSRSQLRFRNAWMALVPNAGW